MVRRVWAECARSGYGLADVCKRIGYEFQHHNALEDAKAAGHVLLAAMAETGLDLEGVLRRVRQPIDPSSASSAGAIRREGNSDGPLFGEGIGRLLAEPSLERAKRSPGKAEHNHRGEHEPEWVEKELHTRVITQLARR